MLNKLTRLKIGLLFVLAHSVSGVAQAEKLPAVVALFGDSITVGLIPKASPDGCEVRDASGSTTHCHGTRTLDALLNGGSPARPAIVTNWGYGGTATGPGNGNPNYGLARINGALSTTKSRFEGSSYIVLIMYGTNDFNVGIGANTTRFNLESIIAVAQAQNFIPIVGNLIPRSDRDLSQYNKQVASAASNRGVPLVNHANAFCNYPGFSCSPRGGWDVLYNSEVLQSTKQAGYLHPKKVGYEVIANNWFNAHLKDLVPTAPTPLGAISLLLLDDELTPP